MRTKRILLMVGVVCLVVTGLAAAAPALSGRAPATGDITGEVVYCGPPVAREIIVAVHPGVNDPPVASVHLDSPGGSYVLPGLADGAYYLSAFLDANGSGGGPPDAGEPLSFYDADGDGTADPVTVSGGVVSGVDLMLAAMPDWTADSNQAEAWFGDGVAAAGDVNGDGFVDVIVGASRYDGAATDSGRAYVFYGSAAGPSATPDQIIEPPYVNLNGFFGFPVSGAGDVNGDTYDDVIIGMTNYDEVTSDEGAAYVYYGSDTGLSSSPDWYARGDAQYAHLGWAVATAGDVNGDTYDDIIVGAYRYDTNSISHAYVWLGSDTGLGANGTPANADWTAAAPTNTYIGHEFGTVVGPAGDVNGDTYDDVLVGATAYDNGLTDEGGVFVWYGSDTGLGPDGTLANADWHAEGEQAEAFLGRAYAAGDVNGDGYGDLIVGAYRYDNGQADEGVAFAWYGSDTGLGDAGTPANADWIGEIDQAGVQFGIATHGAGDFNRDGYDDVVVGGRYFDNLETNEGGAFLFLGGPAGLESAYAWRAESDQDNAIMGRYTSAGDVNNDGYTDLVLSSLYYDGPELDEGRAYVFFGHGLDEPIEGLVAVSDAPTQLGSLTTLTATITAGTNVSYTWAFGDGQMGAGAIITHAYAAPGLYTAVVTAANPLGSVVTQTGVLVQAPIVGLQLFSDSPTTLGNRTTLTATVAAGTEPAYLWDLGDGSSGEGPVVQHTYEFTGAFTVTVTATNALSVDTAAILVTVVEPQPLIYLPAIRQP